MSPSILIVEDDPLIASHIEEVLGGSGYRIAGNASTGIEAVVIAENSQPDLALVDIRLSGSMDGIELAERLRPVPVIFLSGLADDETLERAQAAGCAGFIAKPFRPGQVFNAIEGALARSKP